MESWDYLRKTCDLHTSAVEIPDEARRVFYLAMGTWIENDVHGLWMPPDARDGHSDLQWFAVCIGQRFAYLGDIYNGSGTQSPIEDQLLGALLWVDVEWAGLPKADILSGPDDGVHNEPADKLQFWITPQAQIGKYRADFLLWFKLGRHVGGIAVECDGHAFHEKNKEQASRDKARDRAFLRAGFPVMRFSGSDIFRNPLGCADEVRDALIPILDRVSKDGGMY